MNSNRPEAPVSAARTTVDRAAPVAAGPPFVAKKGVAWATILGFLLLFAGLQFLSAGAGDSDGAPQGLPGTAESARAGQLQERFPGGDNLPAVLVYSTDGTLGTERLKAIDGSVERLAGMDLPDGRALRRAGPTVPLSERAAQATVLLPADLNGFGLNDAVTELRSSAREDLPRGVRVEVTGPAGFAADTAAAFSGANVTLLAVTAAVVAVLLILTYRSPILWLIPLVVVALADRAAAAVTAWLSSTTGWFANDGSTAGITSVLVFGAGTNYALLLVSRYREELRTRPCHRQALGCALRSATPAILSSNLTVVLALLTLIAATVPAFRSLGISSAIGLLLALLFALVLLPALLSVCGRGLFWPRVPRADGHPQTDDGGVFGRVAGAVSRRPGAVLAVMVLVLLCMTAGLAGTRFGLSTTEQFRTDSEAVAGQRTLAENAPAGASAPLLVIADIEAVSGIRDEISAHPDLTVLGPPVESTDGALARLTVLPDAEPASPRSFELIHETRDIARAADPDAVVGGAAARDLDSRDATLRDLRVCVPLILLVVFLVLVVVLRAVLAPLLLLAAAALSTAAALGVGTWISDHVFGFPGLDTAAPLYSILFLIALGIDYTVFLVLRAKEESGGRGVRRGMVRAVALTGGVITSAGIVLAAVFVVLGVLPLITLTQVGIIVGFGILLDTFLVRTLVVPALFELIGERIWWPARSAEPVAAGTTE
ncbi:MMPL family transporter [Corynebacterium sp. TAE3-ERU16]|uniref:MMPL family transporter n=1 Tax=Corynebacterium sp. TAE3-ERU16 TaxID=2849493 RepID=UPI001C4852C9|nr:MMPL family transporter [Corynebacterium sp. TAE3-ERU16]MBV7293793.1 MMPL family transporter [Corynebacterium sp. TAE3-ERU16]